MIHRSQVVRTRSRRRQQPSACDYRQHQALSTIGHVGMTACRDRHGSIAVGRSPRDDSEMRRWSLASGTGQRQLVARQLDGLAVAACHHHGRADGCRRSGSTGADKLIALGRHIIHVRWNTAGCTVIWVQDFLDPLLRALDGNSSTTRVGRRHGGSNPYVATMSADSGQTTAGNSLHLPSARR